MSSTTKQRPYSYRRRVSNSLQILGHSSIPIIRAFLTTVWSISLHENSSETNWSLLTGGIQVRFEPGDSFPHLEPYLRPKQALFEATMATLTRSKTAPSSPTRTEALPGVPSPFPVQELQRLSENPFIGAEEAETMLWNQESATSSQPPATTDLIEQQRLVSPCISTGRLLF